MTVTLSMVAFLPLMEPPGGEIGFRCAGNPATLPHRGDHDEDRSAGAYRGQARVRDTFDDEQGREAHLQGRIAAALGEIAATMLSAPPVIAPVDLLGVKVP
jgi:hypothetical protein